MSAATALPLPPFTEPFAKVPFRQATWTSSERKVYACLLYARHRWGEDVRITNRWGSQWCTEHYGGDPYGSTGRRCFALGLQRLRARGVISSVRVGGGRIITILVNHPAPKTKPVGNAKSKAPRSKASSIPNLQTPVRDATAEEVAAAAGQIAEATAEPAPDEQLSPSDVAAGIRIMLASAVATPTEQPKPRPAPTPHPRRNLTPGLDPAKLAQVEAELAAKRTHPARE